MTTYRRTTVEWIDADTEEEALGALGGDIEECYVEEESEVKEPSTDLADAQEALGHVSAETTAAVYGHARHPGGNGAWVSALVWVPLPLSGNEAQVTVNPREVLGWAATRTELADAEDGTALGDPPPRADDWHSSDNHAAAIVLELARQIERDAREDALGQGESAPHSDGLIEMGHGLYQLYRDNDPQFGFLLEAFIVRATGEELPEEWGL